MRAAASACCWRWLLLRCAPAARPARRSRSRWPTRCARRWPLPSPTARRQARVRLHRRPAGLPALARRDERAAEGRKSEHATRVEFLETVWYESKRAGLEPALVLGLIQVESGFRKYAISSAGARGYMQVMPFWARTDRRRRRQPAVPHADQPALRLRDPAPLPRPGEGRPVPGAGPLQRQPRPRPSTRTRCSRTGAMAGEELRWRPRAPCRAADQPRARARPSAAAPRRTPSSCSTRSTVSSTSSSMLCGRW